jgi:hypothetical protein
LIFPAFTTWIGAEKALLEQKRAPTAGERSGGPRRWVAASTPDVAAQSESTGMCAPWTPGCWTRRGRRCAGRSVPRSTTRALKVDAAGVDRTSGSTASGTPAVDACVSLDPTDVACREPTNSFSDAETIALVLHDAHGFGVGTHRRTGYREEMAMLLARTKLLARTNSRPAPWSGTRASARLEAMVTAARRGVERPHHHRQNVQKCPTP